MTMKGDLLSADLSNVFQMLAMNRKRGVLHIHNRENILEKRALVLDGDRVALLDIPEHGDLTGLLVEADVLSYEDWFETRKKAAQFNVRPIDYLRKKGEIAKSKLDGAVERLHEELILEIFLWKNVGFQLDEDSMPVDDPRRVFFTLDLMVMEAARRQDEWLRVIDMIGGGREIWAKTAFASNVHAVRTTTAEAEEDAITDIDAIVLEHLDGVRGTPQIMTDTGLPRYHVDLAVYKLSQRGMAARMELADLMDIGDQLVAAERVADAIRVFKGAVRYDRRSITIHKRLASCYLKVGNVAKSAAHYKFCAMILLENGLAREALTIYQYVLTIVPTDFKALERGLDVLAGLDEGLTSDDRQSVETGVRLVSFYMDAKLYERAEKVLNALMAIAPEDVGLVFSKARCFAKTGRIKEAVETYMKLAGRLYDLRDYDGAINAYKTVISFDTASRPICQRKIDEIREILDRQQRRKMVGVSAIVFGAAAVLAVCGAIYYDHKADSGYAELESREFGDEERAWLAQAGEFERLAKRFPLTDAAGKARVRRAELLTRVDEKRHAEQRKAEALEAHRASLLEEAAGSWQTGLGHQFERELKQALSCFEHALAKANEGGHEEWAEHPSRRIRTCIESLERRLAWEDERLALLDSLIDKRNFAQAFDVAVDLAAPTDANSLDPSDIKVVSKDALARIRVPVRVRVAPATADIRLPSGEVLPGQVATFLTYAEPALELTITAEGFRERTLVVDWTRGRYDNLIVLAPVPEETLEIGDRVVTSGIVGDIPTMVCASGEVRTLPKGLDDTVRRIPVIGFATVASPTRFGANHVVYGTIDGRVRAFEVARRRVAWRKQLAGDPVEFVALGANRVAAGWNDRAGGHVAILNLSDGKMLLERDLEAPVVSLELVRGDAFAAISANGDFIRFGQEIEVESARLRPGLAVTGGAAHGLTVDGRLLRFERRRSTEVARMEGVRGGISAVGDAILALREDGAVIIRDGAGTRLLTPLSEITIPDSPRFVAIGDDLGVRDESGAIVRFDRSTGVILSAFSGPEDRVSTSIVNWNGRLLVTHGDRSGILEVFPAER